MTKVAIIGAGLIGQSWAIAFARGGCAVTLHDRDHAVADRALAVLPDALAALERMDLLGGETADAVGARIDAASDLADAVRGAIHVQENTPETLEVKRSVFAQLDDAADADAVIASSSSALLPSAFTDGLAGAARCLVAHPLNPPHLVPAVELVPGPQTSAETVARTRALMSSIGQSPIETSREVEGFVMNRLQGALLDEAFALVEQGLASPADIDTAMRDGLARRWTFLGPFETIDLNAPGGIGDFMDRYGPAYAAIGTQRPTRPRWDGTLRERLVQYASGQSSTHDARRAWRDRCLARLARLISANEKATG
ncbi:3-hydroxybutyryl-CoA dehydrogenase [Oceanicola granulosus HTCC2516]|uniref:3-hydroxybutyryl-CoA dehydrogenase n=1 Tax=Oceanicola granulosus (strain ATCC BAA-861 / DSM 15982 / KCTC 12143 / HTCC2516) TaxID=314256 RepID=Q2CEL4_OCEGH|nr:3-hydroxyacyl-CoA dehydrogenase [Oceanicola granulosus]EAR51118.1 3-hydroxybutyryl-CoA dehydrogenase [Oceanicola granulosus HTCC2516]